MFEAVKNVFGFGQKKPTRALTTSEKSLSRTFAAARPGRLAFAGPLASDASSSRAAAGAGSGAGGGAAPSRKRGAMRR